MVPSVIRAQKPPRIMQEKAKFPSMKQMSWVASGAEAGVEG